MLNAEKQWSKKKKKLQSSGWESNIGGVSKLQLLAFVVTVDVLSVLGKLF